MKDFTVILKIETDFWFGFRSRIVNKSVDIQALDPVMAGALVRNTYGGEIIDIQEKAAA